MESLPVGWTVHTCDLEGDGAGLLKGGVADTNTNTHVHDLFHEDAQVGCLQLEYLGVRGGLGKFHWVSVLLGFSGFWRTMFKEMPFYPLWNPICGLVGLKLSLFQSECFGLPTGLNMSNNILYNIIWHCPELVPFFFLWVLKESKLWKHHKLQCRGRVFVFVLWLVYSLFLTSQDEYDTDLLKLKRSIFKSASALAAVSLWSGPPAVQPAVVEDQSVCVGAGALRYLGWSFHHLHDQHLRCGAIPTYRLPGG